MQIQWQQRDESGSFPSPLQERAVQASLAQSFFAVF